MLVPVVCVLCLCAFVPWVNFLGVFSEASRILVLQKLCTTSFHNLENKDSCIKDYYNYMRLLSGLHLYECASDYERKLQSFPKVITLSLPLHD